uniref:Transcription factor n=1 Tax=Solanum tuberosum TaxID=4113 RepID=M0ZGY0_SOLTU
MEKSTSSSVNVPTAGTASMLVETVADLMSMYMQTGYLNDLSVFSDLCLSLAKSVFFSVSALLTDLVYKYRNDFSIQEASMVLLMYVKSACKVGWFRNEDADDLLKLIQEVSRYFSSAEDVDVEPSYVHPYVSRPGFGAFHAGFHIIREMFSPEMEDIFPTVITKMLKYGVNLLQVIGQFDDLEIVETSSRVSLNWLISNSCQVSNQAGDKFVHIITAANGFWKPILQDDSNPSQIYSKSQSIKQLTHENKYSVDPPTLDKIQMQNKPRIVVHASIQVTSVKTNSPANYSQQPQRAFLVPSHLATCGER